MTPSSRSTQTSRTTPRRCPSVGGTTRGGLRRGHRVALRRRRIDPEVGLAPRAALARRQRVRVSCVGAGSTRLHRRLPLLLGPHPAPARPGPGPGRGLRLPDRDDIPGQAAWCGHHRGADQFRGPHRGRVQDVVVHRRGGADAGLVVGPGPDRAWRALRVDGRAAPRGRRQGQAVEACGAAAGAGPKTRTTTGSGAEDAGALRHERERRAGRDDRSTAVAHPRRRRRAEYRRAPLCRAYLRGLPGRCRVDRCRGDRAGPRLPTQPGDARRHASRLRRQRGVAGACATRASTCPWSS